jgi:hypothetical protein
MVVGYQRAETLGDALQLKFHGPSVPELITAPMWQRCAIVPHTAATLSRTPLPGACYTGLLVGVWIVPLAMPSPICTSSD